MSALRLADPFPARKLLAAQRSVETLLVSTGDLEALKHHLHCRQQLGELISSLLIAQNQ